MKVPASSRELEWELTKMLCELKVGSESFPGEKAQLGFDHRANDFHHRSPGLLGEKWLNQGQAQK